MSQANSRTYAFGAFTLIPSERVLLRDGLPVRLTPKAFALLVLLVEHAGSAVSKDQILEALWQGRFVIEANLTKHIWMLRRALGGDDDHYIETVPKLGYRFVATVETSSSDANNSAEHLRRPSERVDKDDVAASTARISKSPKLVAGVLAGALCAAAVMLLQFRHEPAAADLPPPGTIVALTDPSDLSPSQGTTWIGPAVQEMLGTSLSLGSKLRTVPNELVSQATLGLPVPKAGGYGPSSLVALKRRLGTDYVVSGSYFVMDGRTVRLDFVIQDARNHAILGTVTESGKLTDLPAVTTRVADGLYRELTGTETNRIDTTAVAALGPPTSEAMRHMGMGIEALRKFDAARARDEFLETVVDAPDYALAYAELSRAWLDLGYRSKGLAAAEQAAAKSSGLPQRIRLQIAAQRAEAAFDWPAAIASRRSLVALDPTNPDYGLRLVDVLIEAGKLNDAQVALTKLRSLGGQIWTDARVEIAAARLAAARDDTPASVAHAIRALELARAHDAPGQAAEAEEALGAAKTDRDPRGAAAYLMQGLADYRTVGNPRGQARVYRILGNLFSDHDPAKGRSLYTKSLALSQSIGDENGVASAEADMAIVLWDQGDRDGAEAATRRVLQIRKETGDAKGQAWALSALAVGQTDEAASDEAIDNFRSAIALDRTVDATSHIAFSLFSLSDILRLRGNLADAAHTCAQAQAAYATLAEPEMRGQADFECALIALDRGDFDAMRTGLARAAAWAGQHGDTYTVANVELTLGQIEMSRRNWHTAAMRINHASELVTRSDIVAGQALAASLLALCEQASGRAAQAAGEASRAKALRSRMTEREEAVMTDIALAQYRGRTGRRGQALAKLNAIAADAQGRRWVSWALEAKLAAIEFMTPAAAARTRHELAARARQSGFLWVAKRLA